MTWHPVIIYSMEDAITHGTSFDFHGPYNSIVFELFEIANYYNIPHFLEPGVSEPFWYEVQEIIQFRPIFFLEIRAPDVLDSIARRERADLQTRERVMGLVERSKLRVLHGVSAMGPYLCFYKYDKDRPELGITTSLSLVGTSEDMGGSSVDTTPRKMWSYDVRDEEGENRLRGIVEEIKRAMAAETLIEANLEVKYRKPPFSDLSRI